MTSYLTCPGHIRSVHFGHAVVIVDARTGQVETLLGTAQRLWLALAGTGNVQAAARAADLDVQQVGHLADGLLADGLLEATSTPRPWEVALGAVTAPSWGTQEVPAGLPPTRSLPRGQLVLAAAALV
ncbi:MAG: hypothetical protein ACRDTF_11765, partial [Pseudonocardiaceae bacterium]